jgi:hypothetical protein
MDFKLVGKISDIETIAVGRGVRDRARLRRQYGGSRWRKLKGVASVRLIDGTIRFAEVHWYEAHGIGRKEFKLKLPFLDER